MNPELSCFTLMAITPAACDARGIHFVFQMSHSGLENDGLDMPATEKVAAIIELYHIGIAD